MFNLSSFKPALLVGLCVFFSHVACARPIFATDKASAGAADTIFTQRLGAPLPDDSDANSYEREAVMAIAVAAIMITVRRCCRAAAAKPERSSELPCKSKPRVAL